jgi:3-dehydroquinate dehydratase/shikimate dehydrogenase
MTMVCETVTGATMDEIRARRDAVTEADLVEVRLDGVPEPDAAAAVAGARRPVLVTCRPSWEGGAWDGGEPARERLLLEALAAGAAFVDIEWRAPGRPRLLAAAGVRAVLSLHDFTGVPPDLDATARAMAACRPGMVKLAVRAHRLVDVLPLVPIGAALGRDVPLALIAMGAPGLLTRVAAPRFGASLVYGGPGVAPGQLPVSALVHEYGIHRVSADTALLGIVGRPVGHSVSPAMHNAAFEATGRDALYVPLEAASWGDFDEVARRLDIRAASVTAPFKREAWRACARCDGAAEAAGAVNTVRRGVDDAWEGCNTDVEGFLEPLRPHLRAGLRITVVGAGGAARGVVAGLSREPVTVTVRARRESAAAAVAAAAGAHSGPLPVPPGSWDVLVNATPVGTWPEVDAAPVGPEALTGRVVYDLVYNPPDTALLRSAGAAGCETIGGLAMLVAQGARQFSWWTGAAAPIARMRSAAESALAGFRGQQGAPRA